jgi:hypothetical protein
MPDFYFSKKHEKSSFSVDVHIVKCDFATVKLVK